MLYPFELRALNELKPLWPRLGPDCDQAQLGLHGFVSDLHRLRSVAEVGIIDDIVAIKDATRNPTPTSLALDWDSRLESYSTRSS
jgi:hypothetical protein